MNDKGSGPKARVLEQANTESRTREHKRRVLIIAPVHRAWGNRVMREAVSLQEKGYDVEAWLNAPSDSVIDGVRVVGLKTNAHRLLRVLQIPGLTLRAALYNPDVYHVHNPDMLPLGLALKLLGRKVVYDTHEDYARRLMMRHWIPTLFRRPLGALIVASEWLVSQLVDATLVTQAHLVQRYRARAVLLRNAPAVSEKLRLEVERRASGIVESRPVHRLTYAGKITEERGLYTMLDALVRVNQSCNVRLWLAGTDPYGLIPESQDHPGWKYVDFLGLLSHEDVFAHILASDLGLAVMKDVGDHATARPSKLFEYMAFGKPFIASDFPDWRGFIEPTEAGWWIRPDNAERLADTILACLRNPSEMKRRGMEGRSFIESFNWGTESRVLLAVYEKLVGPAQSVGT